MSEELRERVRKLEKWVWGAAAVITAGIALVGLISAADAKEGETLAIMIENIQDYQREKTQTDPNELLDNALKEWESWEQ